MIEVFAVLFIGLLLVFNIFTFVSSIQCFKKVDSMIDFLCKVFDAVKKD